MAVISHLSCDFYSEKKDDEPDMATISVSKKDIVLSGQEGSTDEVRISATGSLYVEGGEEWLEVSPSSGYGDETITITATHMNPGAERKANIQISSNEGEGEIISVTQKALDTIEINPNNSFTLYCQ